jgi:hypothetical protein
MGRSVQDQPLSRVMIARPDRLARTSTETQRAKAEAIHASFRRHHALIRGACNDSGCKDSGCNKLAFQESVIMRKANHLQKVITTKAKTPAPN